MRVVVVGGGITGLSAAYELVHERDDRVEVTVLEADDRFGGKIRTRPFAGHPLDEAADAFLARVPDAVDLCHDVGLDHDLVSPAVRQAYLYSRGELRPFPEGVVLGVPTDLDALGTSGALSPEGVARAALDLSMGPDPARFGVDDPPDESVGAVVRRRVGDEVFERLVAPLLSGVHAGDADRLSLAAGAPQLAAALRDHESLIGGLQAQRAAADPDRPVFFGLAHGSETLTEALVDALRLAGADLRVRAPVEAIGDAGGGFTVRVAGSGEWLDADAVVLTCPLDATAGLLAPLAPDVAAAMAAVAYADVALVALAVPVDGIDRPLDGSGFLVAQPEGLLLTACSWASSKWAHLADPQVALLRASVGRADDTRAGDARRRRARRRRPGRPGHDDEAARRAVRGAGLAMDTRPPPVRGRPSRPGPHVAGGAGRRSPGTRSGRSRDDRTRHPGLHRPGPGGGAFAAGGGPVSDPSGKILLLLHGYEDEPVGKLVPPGLDGSWEVVEPRGPVELPGGPAWFASDDDGPVEAHLIASLDELDRMVDDLDRGSAVLVVGGSSQGGAVALAWALRSRSAPDGVFCVNGWLPAADSFTYHPEALSAAGTRVLVVGSRDDEVVPVQAGRSAARYLERGGVDVTAIELDGGHHISAEAVAAVATWLASLHDGGPGQADWEG